MHILVILFSLLFLGHNTSWHVIAYLSLNVKTTTVGVNWNYFKLQLKIGANIDLAYYQSSCCCLDYIVPVLITEGIINMET